MHLYDVERGNLGANAVVGGGLPAITRRRARVQAARRAARRARVLRRRRDEHRHVPRGAQPRAAVARAGRLRVREQPLGGVDARVAAPADRGPRRSGPRRSACTRSRSTARTSRRSASSAREALEHARSGDGPVFLLANTYRLTGHYVGDPQVYRDKDEFRETRETQDPIDKLRDRLELSDEEWEQTRRRGDEGRRGVGRVREERHRSRARGRAEERLCLS